MLEFPVAKPPLIEVQICPSLLVKKDRGRPVDPKAQPKAFGEVTVASNVPGAELLDENISSEGEGSDNESDAFDSDDEMDLASAPPGTEENMEGLSVANKHGADGDTKEEDEASDDEDGTGQDDSNNDSDELDDDSDMDADTDISDVDEDEDDDELKESINGSEDEASDQDEDSDEEDKSKGSGSKVQKRKLSDYIGELNAADASLRALKRLATAKKAEVSSDETGKILSDEDFKHIKELKVCEFWMGNRSAVFHFA
jgi:protein SDA1